ncbi:hypothetical protein MSC49_23030 [Methylosinus sp. C49]|nr:hypothetical protein MSC49_23030 [Methylosinus sp. C49]
MIEAPGRGNAVRVGNLLRCSVASRLIVSLLDRHRLAKIEKRTAEDRMGSAQDSKETVRLVAVLAIVAIVSLAVVVGLRMWK